MATHDVSFLFAFMAGVLSFVSPCVLPLIPAYISFVTGMSLERLTEGREAALKKTVLLSSVFFIAGFSTIFMAMGASASFFGEIFTRYQNVVRIAGGIVIILFGLHIMGLLNFSILHREKRLGFLEGRPAGTLGAFFVGMGFAAGWTPCVGPILASILIMAGTSKTVWSGIMLLGAYSLGFAVPFLIVSLGINVFLRHFHRIKRYMNVISTATGVFLVIAGLAISTDYFAVFTEFLNIIFPNFTLKGV